MDQLNKFIILLSSSMIQAIVDNPLTVIINYYNNILKIKWKL